MIKRKSISVIVIIAFLMNIVCTPIFATSKYYINSNEALHKLESLGFSDIEILENYQIDANRMNSTIKLPSELSERIGIYYVKPYNKVTNYSFPSNPKVGQKYTLRYDVNFMDAFEAAGLKLAGVSTVTGIIQHFSPSLVIKAIAGAIGWGVSAILFAEMIYYYIKKKECTGVRGSAKYVYGLTDDLTYDWIFIHGSDTRTYY